MYNKQTTNAEVGCNDKIVSIWNDWLFHNAIYCDPLWLFNDHLILFHDLLRLFHDRLQCLLLL